MLLKKMIPAIVLSSHNIGLAVIRALGIRGVPVFVMYYDNKDMGYVSKYVKEYVRVPHPGKSEEQFVDALISHADRFGHGILFPADDATLTAVSRHKKALAAHYIVAAVGSEIAEKFLVKKHTYAIAEQINIPVPRTLVPRSLDDLEARRNEIEFPCLIKPCQSHLYVEHFGRKMTKVANYDQLAAAFKEAERIGLEVMVQELIPGDDAKGVNYNSYFWNGLPLAEFTAEKVRLSPPGFGIPRVVVSKDVPEIVESGRRLLNAIGFQGYSCTEFKKDARDNRYKLMEVNGRHNRSALLAVRCGVNFPWIEYNHLAGNGVALFRRPQQGTFWIDEFKDVVDTVHYAREERYSLNEYVRPYMRPHVFATFDRKDLKPFFKRCVTVMGIGLKKAGALLKKRTDFHQPPDGHL